MNDFRNIPYFLQDMQLRDIDEVMVIEHLSFASPWTVRAYQYELVHNSFSQFLVVRRNASAAGDVGEPPKPRRRFLFSAPQPALTPILGYAGLWLLVDEAHISTIAVAPEWRGFGLGELLLVGLLERALAVGGEVATLEVRVSNEVAQNLYRKYLFQTVGRRRGYYRDNQEDALIMTTPPLQGSEFQEVLLRHRQALADSLIARADQPKADRASSLLGQRKVVHVGRALRPAVLAGVLVIGIALALYLSTLDNGLRLEELHGGDLVTHQYAQVQARPSNAPGYPLYTLGGWLWFHAGRGLLSSIFNPTEILSLYSTLWGLLALVVLYALLREITNDNWPIAALMTLFYAFTYFFWYYSCSTEQYTSAVFQTLLMVLWAFRWERTHEDRYLYLLAFMTGLCLANLVTVLFVVPPLLVLIVTGRPRVLRRPKLIALCVLLALLPLLSYVYVYVRGAQHPEWWGAGEWHSAAEWFVSFVSTQQGRDEMTWALGPLTAEFPGLIFWDMSVVGVALALCGWWLLGRRRGGFLFGVLAIYFGFSYIDRFGNWYQVFMPIYPLLVVGMAVTLNAAWRWTGGRTRKQAWRAALLIVIAALVVSRLTYPDPRAFQRNRPDDDGLKPGWALLFDQPPEGATIIGDADQFVSLQYLTDIWGVRADVHAAQLNEGHKLLAQRQPELFFTREVSPLVMQEADVPLHPSGYGAELVSLHDDLLQELPGSAHAMDLAIGDALRLVGYELPRAEPAPAPGSAAEQPPHRFHLTLYWTTAEKMDRDWSVSVRPTWHGQLLPVATGIVQMDVAHPVLGLYPMTAWTPGEIVRDDYVILLDAGQAFDGAQVVVYGTCGDGFENLGVVDLPLGSP